MAIGTEIAQSQIAELSASTPLMYASFDATTQDGKVALFEATDSSESIADHIGKVIALKDIVVIPNDLTNDNGEITTVLRTILIDKDGVCYSAVSDVLLRRIRIFFQIFGEPAEWDAPKNVMIVEEKSASKRSFFNLKLAK